MAVKLNIALDSPSDIALPTDRRDVLIYLENLLRKMRSGNTEGNYGLSVSSGLTQATGTVTAAAAATNDTITLNGTVLTGIVYRATATAACVTVLATQTVTVNGKVFTAVDSAPTSVQFLSKVGGTDDTGTAVSLAAAVNALSAAGDPLLVGIRATSSTGTVTFRAVDAGAAGNSFTLAKSDATVSISGATFAGGIALVNNKFDTSPGTTVLQQATDIARCINASTTAAVVNAVVATAPTSGGVVALTAHPNWPGTVGNAITLVSSNGTRLAVSAATLTSGATATAPVRYVY
jgi:hypothetical protein